MMLIASNNDRSPKYVPDGPFAVRPNEAKPPGVAFRSRLELL